MVWFLVSHQFDKCPLLFRQTYFSIYHFCLDRIWCFQFFVWDLHTSNVFRVVFTAPKSDRIEPSKLKHPNLQYAFLDNAVTASLKIYRFFYLSNITCTKVAWKANLYVKSLFTLLLAFHFFSLFELAKREGKLRRRRYRLFCVGLFEVFVA